MELSFDTPVEAKLSDLRTGGQSARLRDLTDFSWDQVHLFHEGASREDIEEVVGSPVIRGNYYFSSASLLVFEENGKIVKAIAVTGDYLRSEGDGTAPGPLRRTYPSDVVVEPWGLGFMRLTQPQADPGT